MQLPFIFCTSHHLFPAVVHTYCVNSSNFLSQSDAMPDFVLLFLFQFLSIQQSLHLLFLLFHIHRHAFLCSILTGVDIRPACCFRSDNPVCIYRHHIGVRAGIRRLIAGRYRRIYSCTFPRMKCNRRLLKCNLWRSDRHFTILLTPSTVTVMTAVPCLTAVTFPVSSTVATLFCWFSTLVLFLMWKIP